MSLQSDKWIFYISTIYRALFITEHYATWNCTDILVTYLFFCNVVCVYPYCLYLSTELTVCSSPVWFQHLAHTYVASGWNIIVSKLFQICQHLTEIILFQCLETCLKLFQNYFRSLLQLMNIFQRVQCCWIIFEMISVAEIILFQLQTWLHVKRNSKTQK